MSGLRVLICYAPGSAGPLEIRYALGAGVELAFLVEDNLSEQMMMLLDALGRVLVVGPSLEETRKVVERWGPSVIATFSEECLETALSLRMQLGLSPNLSVDTIERLTSKVQQRRILEELGISSLAWTEWSESESDNVIAEIVGFPAVIKPSRGSGSAYTFRLDGIDDLGQVRSVLRNAPPRSFIVEEMLVGVPLWEGVGDYFSLETLWSAQGPAFVSVTGKLPLCAPFRETGQFVFQGDHREYGFSEARSMVEEFLRAIGAPYGWYHSEFKSTAYGPAVIEINGRLGGNIGDLLQRSYGLNAIESAVGVSLGGFVDPVTVPPRAAYCFTTPFPTIACSLNGIRGSDQLGAFDSYREYQRKIRFGVPQSASVATRNIDIVKGALNSTRDIADEAAAMGRVLRYDFAVGDEVFTLSGHDLRQGKVPGQSP